MKTPNRSLLALTLSLLTLLTACAQNAPQAPEKAIFIPQQTGPAASPPLCFDGEWLPLGRCPRPCQMNALHPTDMIRAQLLPKDG
ncbi:hypothetical protein [Deinococcus wulumuqiensis]|uniref:hypothetical protein n=1 Tax=Deinococcus wulumuqiensis TaxID=980427 RepID=UPI0035EF236C